ncbi:elongator complex protein 5 isoform X2 [Cimex lectularius]|uniref:Elongator complex protein 5 n=1 Tax=Cimex lectularius TaxID=79782 RepID=A0A8I6SIW5_CIMLE|nr:elongator complex protein 5 isoform X2 [Cimex lectularius]
MNRDIYNYDLQGQEFIKQFVNENVNRRNRVLFFAYENSYYSYLKDVEGCKLFSFYHCLQDPWNWLNKSGDNGITLDPKMLESKLENGFTNLIVVDSLLYTLLNWSFSDLCKKLRSIIDMNNENRRVQVISTYHKDHYSEESSEIKQLRTLARSIIKLKHTPKGTRADVTHKKYSGKISYESYCCSYKSNGTLEYSKVKQEEKESSGLDPTKLTTFKLSLEDNEKETRSQVVLPYLKTTQAPKGAIFYEPDNNDDWDDEDPDDDLEI